MAVLEPGGHYMKTATGYKRLDLWRQTGSGLQAVDVTVTRGTTSSPPPVTVADFRTQPLLDPGPGKVVLGMFTSRASLASLASKAGVPQFYAGRLYSGSGVLAGISKCQDELNGGRHPLLSINFKDEMRPHVEANPTNVGGTGLTLFEFYAAGHFDGRMSDGYANVAGVGLVPGFRAVARALLALTAGSCPSRRVSITPWHEMENTLESGFGTFKTTAGYAAFRAGWQKFVSILREEGCDSFHFPIVFMGGTGPSHWGYSMTDNSSTGFYAGHLWVDAVGFDPYNSSGLISATGQRPGQGRWKNTWRPFGIIGNRGDGAGSGGTTIDGNGGMTWWHTNFEVGGAASGAGPIYKPCWIGETGTGTHDYWNDPTNPDKRATTWYQGMADWLQAHPGIITHVYIFNNNLNDVDVGPVSPDPDGDLSNNYRPTGFAGLGTHPVWATVS